MVWENGKTYRQQENRSKNIQKGIDCIGVCLQR